MLAGRTSCAIPTSVSRSRRRGDCDASTTGTSSPLPLGLRGRCTSALQPERYRTVIHELNVHHRAKLARRDRDAPLTKVLDESFVERNSRFGTSGVDEARPPPLGGITVKRELRDDQQLTADVSEREVHFVLGVREQPQTDDLVRHPGDT